MSEHSGDSRYRLVLELARQVTARRDLDDVLATTFSGLRRVLPFTGGSIQLLDDEGWIRMAATDPPAAPEIMALRIPLGSTVGGRIVLTERPVYIPDVLQDPSVPPERRKAHLSPGGVRSYFGVPLLAEGHAIGLVQIDSTEPDAWDDDDRLLLLSAAPVVAAAIQNARAHAVQSAAARRADALERRQAELDEHIDHGLRHTAATLLALTDADHVPDDPARLRERLAAAHEEAQRLARAIATLQTTTAPEQTPERQSEPLPGQASRQVSAAG